MWQQSVTDKFLKTLEAIEYGSISVTMPSEKHYEFQGSKQGAHGHMYIKDLRTIPALAAKGDIGLAEAYRNGWWDSDDLTSLFLVGLQNEQALDGYIYGSVFSRMSTQFLYLFTRLLGLHAIIVQPRFESEGVAVFQPRAAEPC